MNLEKLKSSIFQNEDLKLKPYLCSAGRLTIGYGRNLEDNGISKSEALFLLENDLLNIKLELEDKLSVYKLLDHVRQNVLLEMAYNMGVPNLLKFKNTIRLLKEAVNCKNQDDKESYFYSASIEMLNSKWHKDFINYDLQDGKRGNSGLLRSEYLSKLMEEGKF